MDLQSLKFNDETKFQLRHPVTDEPLENDKGEPMLIGIVGTDSQTYRKLIRKLNEEKLKRRSKSVDLDKAEQEALDILVGCTTSFENIQVAGKAIKVDEAESLYREYRWIKEQVDRAIGDRSNFLPT